MPNINTCCYGCQKRSMHCHSTCKEYAEYVKRNTERRETRGRERKARQDVYDHVLKTVDSVRRHKR